MANTICSIDGCDRRAVARGWCPTHWYRWSVNGDPLPDLPVIARAIDFPDGTRACSRCAERKAIDQFDKVKSAKLGRRSTCKSCRSADMKAWYQANAEKRRAAQRARRAENPEKYREIDRSRNSQEAQRELHADRVHRRRALVSGGRVDPGLTRGNLRKQYGDECFYCCVEMDFRRLRKSERFPTELATIEHVVPISAGGTHTWDNVVLACWGCNRSKRNTPLEEWQRRNG